MIEEQLNIDTHKNKNLKKIAKQGFENKVNELFIIACDSSHSMYLLWSRA
jgi:hypothetical protein